MLCKTILKAICFRFVKYENKKFKQYQPNPKK